MSSRRSRRFTAPSACAKPSVGRASCSAVPASSSTTTSGVSSPTRRRCTPTRARGRSTRWSSDALSPVASAPSCEMTHMNDEAVFSGLKVLDIASYIAAPAAAAVLGDLGADVIKVEPPGLGDLQRYLGRTAPNPRAKANYAWHMTNRSKRGMVIDLKSPGGTKILERLVRWADVLVTNYPHGAREKLHLGYDEVAAWNSRLIYADITGFGDDGPDAALPGFDITAYWARTGLLASTRDAGAPPTLPVQGSGDYAAAIALYGAIVTGLYLRERTGSGVHVGTSLLAAGAWATATLIAGALAGGEFFGLHDRTAPPNPLINPYQSADGVWFVLVAAPPHWPGLARAIGHSELLEDARFANPRDFGANGPALAAILDAEFRSKPLEHC